MVHMGPGDTHAADPSQDIQPSQYQLPHLLSRGVSVILEAGIRQHEPVLLPLRREV